MSYHAAGMSEQPPYTRSMCATVHRLSALFPCVLVTGARQVGKSTMLRSMLPPGMRYITLDDPELAEAAQQNPQDFLAHYEGPLCLDEIQYAPALLRAIKQRVDAERQPGMYWMTGSQRFRLMKGISESLAGRMGILELRPLSNREQLRCPESFFAPDAAAAGPAPEPDKLYERVIRGGYPELIARPDMEPELFFRAYVSTYVERDVHDLAQIGNRSAFIRLMRSAASRTGQQLVYSHLARDAGVAVNTVKSWVSILEASGIITLLEPYHCATSQRLTKSPKLYFNDTGLAAWLCRLTDADELERSPLAGAFVETWAFNQLMAGYENRGLVPDLCYFRNSNGAELDFVLHEHGRLYAMEVKSSTHAQSRDLRHGSALPVPPHLSLGPATVLCNSAEAGLLPGGNRSYPLTAL